MNGDRNDHGPVRRPRRPAPRHLLALVALVLVAASFAPRGVPAGSGWRWLLFADQHFSLWFSVLAVFAFVLGGLNLLAQHLARVVRRREDWPYSMVTVVSFLVVLVAGLFKIGGPPGLQGSVTHPDSLFSRLFEDVLTPLHATLFSLLAFYVVSASFRAFRIRSRETAVLAVAAVLVLLGRIPFAGLAGHTLLSRLPFEDVSLWILSVPNTAGQRALMIGIALGTVALSLRMILGLEQRGDDREEAP